MVSAVQGGNLKSGALNIGLKNNPYESYSNKVVQSRLIPGKQGSGPQVRKCAQSAKHKHLTQGIIISIVLVIILIGAAFCAKRLKDIYALEYVPKEITEFAKKNPEASGYAKNYNLYKDVDFEIDVSSEIDDGGIPLFIQWDKRWGYRNYGENYIGIAGCGPTSLAMVACGLTGDDTINPYIVAKYSYEQGYYTYGVGTSWELMTTGAEHFGIRGTAGTISSSYILENLSEDTPMICSMKPGDFTSTGHFIVLAGFYSDGTIIVNDPNSYKNSAKHWNAETLADQMKAIWCYSK